MSEMRDANLVYGNLVNGEWKQSRSNEKIAIYSLLTGRWWDMYRRRRGKM